MGFVTPHLTIGEFARRCRLSASALRFYDECGLLRPVDVDPASGYRSYAEAQLSSATLIRDLRQLGMSIASIRRVLDEPVGLRHEAVDKQIAALEASLVDARGLARLIHLNIDEMEDGLMYTLSGAELADALAQVLPAVDPESRHEVLRGVLVEGRDGSVRVVGTDSYRLAVRDLVPRRASDDDFRVVVSCADLVEVPAWLVNQPSVALGVGEAGFVLRGTDEERRLRTVPGDYPDFEPFLSVAERAHRLIVSRDDLCAAIDPCQGKKMMRLRFAPGELVLSAGRDVNRRINGSYSGVGLEFALNPSFAMDAATAAVGPDLVIEATSATDAVVFRSADDGTFTTMVMPVLAG